MAITGIVPQLRTRDTAATIRFYTKTLGFCVEFNYQDLYAGIRPGRQLFHLKQVDEEDPSIRYVEEGGHLHLYLETQGVATLASQLQARGVPLVKEVHETPWSTRAFVIHDDQGHTLYFGELLQRLTFVRCQAAGSALRISAVDVPAAG